MEKSFYQATFRAKQIDHTLPEPDPVCAVPSSAEINCFKLDRQENKLGHRMPRVNFTRTDRIAQMSKQEQLIAQKRQQILEKQRTLQMAKQIAAEASKATPAGAEDEQGADSSGTLKLPFSNDGSFLENFKKLSEKFAKTAEDGTKRAAEEEVASTSEKKFKPDEATTVAILPPPPPPLPPPSMPTIASTAYAYGQPPPMMSYSQEMIPVQLQPMMVIEPQQQQELQQQNYPGPSSLPPPPPQPPVLEQVPEVGANCKGSCLKNSPTLTETIGT